MSEIIKHYHVLLENRDYLVKAHDDVDATLQAEEWDTALKKRLESKFSGSGDELHSIFQTSPMKLPLAFEASEEERKFQEQVWYPGKETVSLIGESFGIGAPVDKSTQPTSRETVDDIPLFAPLSQNNTLAIDRKNRMYEQGSEVLPWPQARDLAVGLIAITGSSR